MKVIAQPAFGGRSDNPYTWLLYQPMQVLVADYSFRGALAGRYNILHLHWPERELNAYRGRLAAGMRLWMKLALIDAMRARGTKVVWTVHNLNSHEGLHPRMEPWFWNAFTKRVDGFIALSEAGKLAARERFPRLQSVPGYVIPHGHYRGEYAVDASVDARRELGIAPYAKVVLFFGLIREYKNVPGLIRAFREVAGEDRVLLVAGRPHSAELAEALRREAAGDPRIRLHLQSIPNERVQLFFRAADLVALPYRDILNSGTALLALSFNRPVLVPGRGAMSELRASIGADWVRTYTGDVGSAELEQALQWAVGMDRPAEAPLSALEWPKIAEQTVQAYSEILAMRRPADAAVGELVSRNSTL
jgi:glycosyltransferase involved in cell wall biosynthesis